MVHRIGGKGWGVSSLHAGAHPTHITRSCADFLKGEVILMHRIGGRGEGGGVGSQLDGEIALSRHTEGAP
jgi:hypothetical protein